MAGSLVGRATRTAFDVAATVYPHPSLKWRAMDLKFRQEADLSEIARRYGVRTETLTKQLQSGCDNPGLRFHRDAGFFDFIRSQIEDLTGSSWLDVGADTGALTAYLSDMLGSNHFELIDVDHGDRSSKRWNADFSIRIFDGTHLKYADGSFDLVILSYVLHHAADSTIPLLQDAKRIARKYVFVLEDPKDTSDDYEWAYTHDKKGTFRGHREWLALFRTLNLEIVHDEPLSCEIHSRHFYALRAMM
jgi:SAM-dependent methyltransferase